MGTLYSASRKEVKGHWQFSLLCRCKPKCLHTHACQTNKQQQKPKLPQMAAACLHLTKGIDLNQLKSY